MKFTFVYLAIQLQSIEYKKRLLTIKYSEPEKTTGPSGVKPIAVLKRESNVEIY